MLLWTLIPRGDDKALWVMCVSIYKKITTIFSLQIYHCWICHCWLGASICWYSKQSSDQSKHRLCSLFLWNQSETRVLGSQVRAGSHLQSRQATGPSSRRPQSIDLEWGLNWGWGFMDCNWGPGWLAGKNWVEGGKWTKARQCLMPGSVLCFWPHFWCVKTVQWEPC